jgi:RNA polymerase sigma-70 factor (ECF subfamily)
LNTTPGPKPADDDATLLAQSRAGDASAFTRLVEAHQDRVARLAFRLLGWSSDVGDVGQDVFVCVLQNARRFRGDSRFATWLTRIVINQCRTHQRRRLLRLRTYREWAARQRVRESKPRDVPDSHDQVRAAVGKLPSKYREVIVLRYFEELSVREMSDLLRVSEGALQVRLTRARRRLKEQLTDCFQDGGVANHENYASAQYWLAGANLLVAQRK